MPMWSNHPTPAGRRLRPGIQVASKHERRIISQALGRNPGIRFTRPWFFMAAVVAVANDISVGRLVILKCPSQARACGHVRGTVSANRVERVRADPNRM